MRFLGVFAIEKLTQIKASIVWSWYITRIFLGDHTIKNMIWGEAGC